MKLSDKAQAALDKVVARFESGDLSPITQISKLHLNPNCPASRWSFGNQVLAYAQTDSLDCRGYRQWQEAGRQVKKGETAAFILGPVTVKKTRERDGDEEEYNQLVGWRAIPVFAYHQTDGDGDAMDYAPQEPPPLADVAERMGIDVRYHPLPPNRLGDCAVDGSQINVGAHDAAVFFHELGHAVHARLNGNGRLKGGQDTEQETVAEFTATVLMWLYGYGDRTGNCWQYIAMYSTEPLRAIMEAMGTVQAILQILEGECND